MPKIFIILTGAASLAIAAISAHADLGKTPTQTAESAGGQSFDRKAWHSPKVDVYAWHPKIGKGQDDSLIRGITEVVGFARGKSVIEIIFLTDAQTSRFPEGKALFANLAIWSGDVDWVQMNDSEETQLWKIDGQTAVLMSKNNAIVILDDDWVSEITMDKVAPFIAEITAWSGV
jgi:hypothetical protein